MCFQFTVSFVIRPKAALLEWSVGTSLEDDAILAEPVLWTDETNARVAWTREEHVEGTKAIFVHHVRGFLPDNIWQSLAGSLADVDVFDKYWNVEVFWGVDEFVEHAIPPDSIKELASKGNRFIIALASRNERRGLAARPDAKG